MPTSVTGTSEYAVTRTAQRGFSFLELLVVVAIIGLLAAAVSWSIGALGNDRELADESTRLRGVLTLLHEESLMQGRDYAVMFTQTGYRFYVYDYQQLAWVEPQADELLAQHALKPQLLISLLLDGRPVQLDNDFESRDVDTPEPQIMLLASGEVTPFAIEVARDGVEGHFELTAQLDGKLTVTEEDFD